MGVGILNVCGLKLACIALHCIKLAMSTEYLHEDDDHEFITYKLCGLYISIILVYTTSPFVVVGVVAVS